MDNACKYTEEGHIILSVKEKEIEESNSEIYIYFRVEDTGCGIKEKAIPNIFDSFQRLELRKHADIQGTGLGLAISKRLVESMGGEITVESVYGEGSIFSFYVKQRIWDPVPMGRFEGQKEEKEEEDLKKTFVAPKARILCVDDNLTNRKVIRELLSLYKIDADIAASGKECLEIMKRDSGYHLIFMDYMMPGMDGMETVKRMFDSIPESRKIPVVALTADAVVGVKELLLNNGFSDYVAKPVELSELEKILLKYLPEDIVNYVSTNRKDADKDMKIEIPDVNVNTALKRYDGDSERYVRALGYLCEDGEKQLGRMKDMLGKKDYEAFGCEAHAVKGLTLGIGAEKVSEMAKKEEFAVKEGRFEDAAHDANAFFESYEKLLVNMRQVLNEKGLLKEGDAADADGATDELPEISEEEYKAELKTILEAIDLLDAGSAEKEIRKLLGFRIEKDANDVLKKALADVKDFEYDSAKSRVAELV